MDFDCCEGGELKPLKTRVLARENRLVLPDGAFVATYSCNARLHMLRESLLHDDVWLD